MKKIISLLMLSLFLFLASCGEEEIDISPLESAVSTRNSDEKISGKYLTEITFGAGSVLYYVEGDVNFDRTEKICSAKFKQTYLGASADGENYFKNGEVISVCDGEAISVSRDADELFSKFPYCKITIPADMKNPSVSENSLGKAYTFYTSDTKNIYDTTVGGDLYELAAVIKKPQKDKTVYGDTKCIFTVNGGTLVSVRYEFDVTLFDTPAYNPTYSVPESEYTVKLHINAKISYVSNGDDVSISEFSGEITE